MTVWDWILLAAAAWITTLALFVVLLAVAEVGDRRARPAPRPGGWDIDADFTRVLADEKARA